MTQIPVSKILPNPEQPRKNFDQAELDELARSMASFVGLIQPITVRKAEDVYILVDGERRWRAAKQLGWKTIEAHIRNIGNGNDNSLLEAMVANIQRSGMKPLEEARAYQKLIEKAGTQERVADLVGVSIATVGMRLSLLEFDPKIQQWFDDKRIPLDCGVISAIGKLPEDQRLDVCRTAVIRGSTAKAIKAMSSRRLVDGKPVYHPIPRHKPEEKIPGSDHFNALQIVDKKIPNYIAEAVTMTCQNCPLYEDASQTNCRQCPVVDLLKFLPEKILEDGKGIRFEIDCARCGKTALVKSLNERNECSKCGKVLLPA